MVHAFVPIAIYRVIILGSVNCPVASSFLKGHCYLIALYYILSRHSVYIYYIYYMWDSTRCYWWYLRIWLG